MTYKQLAPGGAESTGNNKASRSSAWAIKAQVMSESQVLLEDNGNNSKHFSGHFIAGNQ
jgi:hypothetical protein